MDSVQVWNSYWIDFCFSFKPIVYSQAYNFCDNKQTEISALSSSNSNINSLDNSIAIPGVFLITFILIRVDVPDFLTSYLFVIYICPRKIS